MRLSDIMKLLEQNSSPSNWVKVNDEIEDGGNVCFCVEDVNLLISFRTVWKSGKLFMNFRLNYGVVVILWFDLPVLSLDQVPDHVRALTLVTRRLKSLGTT
jgi:hypothetical protein